MNRTSRGVRLMSVSFLAGGLVCVIAGAGWCGMIQASTEELKRKVESEKIRREFIKTMQARYGIRLGNPSNRDKCPCEKFGVYKKDKAKTHIGDVRAADGSMLADTATQDNLNGRISNVVRDGFIADLKKRGVTLVPVPHADRQARFDFQVYRGDSKLSLGTVSVPGGMFSVKVQNELRKQLRPIITGRSPNPS